jgi:hypothetical protein
MPVMQREWGDTIEDAEREAEHEAEDFAITTQSAQAIDSKNDINATTSFKNKLRLEAKKREEERKKAHMQTIHNTVSKNLIGNRIPNASYSVKLAEQRVYGAGEHGKAGK